MVKDLNSATLKNLNVKECIGLAKFLYPEYKWFYEHPTPDNIWDGHDIVTGKFHTLTGYTATLKIDYREDVNNEFPRVYFQSNGERTFPDTEKVIQYLIKIGKLWNNLKNY